MFTGEQPYQSQPVMPPPYSAGNQGGYVSQTSPTAQQIAESYPHQQGTKPYPQQQSHMPYPGQHHLGNPPYQQAGVMFPNQQLGPNTAVNNLGRLGFLAEGINPLPHRIPKTL